MSRRTQKPKQPESFLNWPFAFRKPTESREARKEEKGDFRQLPTKTSTKLPACNRIVIFFSSHVFNLSSLLQRPRNPPFPPTVAQPASQLWRAEIMKHPHHCFLKGNKRGQINGLRLTSSGKTNQTLGIEHAHPHTRDPAPSHADTNSRASKRRTQEGTKLQRPCLRPTSSSPLLLPSRHASLRSSVLLFSLAWLVDASSAPRTLLCSPLLACLACRCQ
jgi:hypothetical protein